MSPLDRSTPRTMPVKENTNTEDEMTMTANHLQSILASHLMWLEKKPGGRRANLCRADLRDANLGGADLGGADLWRADLRDANLCRADLRDAGLRDADLCRADLRDADLRDADLRHTVLDPRRPANGVVDGFE